MTGEEKFGRGVIARLRGAVPRPKRVALGGPFRAQIFAHLEISGQRIAGEFPRKTIGERRPVDLAHVAIDMDFIAHDRARKITRHKISLVSARQPIALLLDVQRMIPGPGRELDLYIPAAGEISGRSGGRRGTLGRTWSRKNLVDSVPDDFVLARRHHVRRDGQAPAGAAKRDAGFGRVENMRQLAPRDPELFLVPRNLK